MTNLLEKVRSGTAQHDLDREFIKALEEEKARRGSQFPAHPQKSTVWRSLITALVAVLLLGAAFFGGMVFERYQPSIEGIFNQMF